VTIAGMSGQLLPPDRRVAAYFDNHFRFFWRDAADHHYVLTVHDLGPDTMTVFRLLLASLRPGSSLTATHRAA
jgi:hypothetical protein